MLNAKQNARKITIFDGPIKNNHALFVLPFDWRLLKAQLIAESCLNPAAKSPAGAIGLAQFMPETWSDMQVRLKMPLSATPYSADFSIKACAFYMGTLIGEWSAPRPEIDRYCLALASYNAGIRHVLKAQKLAGGSNDYHQIISQLPIVTGQDNAKQTTDYVQRILSEWQTMILEG